MWMIFTFFIGLIFVVIGVVKNKDGEYLKKGAFSLIVISIMASMLFLYAATGLQNGGVTMGFGFFDIAADKVDLLFKTSMLISFFALIAYLFADYQN